MEHTNKAIIKALREEYSDYDYNTCHYDRQYKMIENAMKIAAEEAERKRYPHCWGKMNWILKYDSGKEPAQYVCSCKWGSKECLRLTREYADSLVVSPADDVP